MELKTIYELKGMVFDIPFQQRGYKWRPKDVERLLDDFVQFLDQEKPMYCLQPIAVVNNEEAYTVIDGQQRLTTLFLLWKYLYGEKPYTLQFERDSNDSDRSRQKFLEDIDKIEKEDDRTIDSFYISNAYLTIKKWFEKHDDKKGVFENLLSASNKAEKSVQVLWYEVPPEKAHEAFRNINSGKIQLNNCDLIKALLLNSTSQIENRQQIAAQYELMERQLAIDRFWFMLQRKDVESFKGQSRFDLLFNLVTGVDEESYKIEPRSSFFELSKRSDLLGEWKNVRNMFQRLLDWYENPRTFHYVGFLTYCGAKLNDILDWERNMLKSKFEEKLRTEIKNKLNLKKNIDEYSYGDHVLNKLFVLHNIETLLCRYKELNEKKGLMFSYENFPFEMLYSTGWDIEHIASQTDNELKRPGDREDWVDSVFADFSGLSNDDNIKKLKEEAENDWKNDEKFSKLYDAIINMVNDNSIKEDKKNYIGNLVLLDKHTNRSFHNSLFPRKRRIVIKASGMKCDTEKDVESVYIPICTQQVYTKSYNTNSNVNLNSWGDDDYDAYLDDIKKKLDFYLK